MQIWLRLWVILASPVVFCIHSEKIKPADSLAFSYPKDSEYAPPCISGMYFYYHTLASIFCQSLVPRVGDTTNCLGYFANLLYYCHPDRLRKIDGCDFVYCELRRAALDRMTPTFCVYVQKLLNRVVPPGVMAGERVEQEQLTLSLRGQYPEVPSMMPPEQHTKAVHDPQPHFATRSGSRRPIGESSSSRPRPKGGATTFFKRLF